jgi:hypothetical protein
LRGLVNGNVAGALGRVVLVDLLVGRRLLGAGKRKLLVLTQVVGSFHGLTSRRRERLKAPLLAPNPKG